jgi:hypothetical protein
MAWIWNEAVVAAAHDQDGFPSALMAEWSRSTAAWRVSDGVTAIDVARALRDGLPPKNIAPQEPR